MKSDPLLTLVAALVSAGYAQLHNGRGGFACNSSSSHSVVVLPEGMTLGHDSPGGGTYSWDDFALTEPGEKIRYLAAMVRNQPEALDALAGLIAEHDAGVESDDYVDHDSHLAFPEDFYGDRLDPEFLTDVGRLLAHPDVAILGGNDNGGETRYITDGMIEILTMSHAVWRARKDTVDGKSWWVLFNVTDGTKLRISLNVDDLRAVAARSSRWRGESVPEVLTAGPFTPAKAGAPELVDVKLTDACAYESDCGWCYMGSTKDGQAGDVARIANVLAALAEQKVFEIAFGGGEPTLWPGFTETLDYTRSLGMVPNFTTKNYSWLTGPNSEQWLEAVGAVAFSVNTATAMNRLTKKADAIQKTNPAGFYKLTVQLIPDLVPAKDFTHILTEAAKRRWRVTLLGYKTTGRGGEFTPAFKREPGWWIDAVRTVTSEHRLRTVAIDTALALSSQDALAAANVPKWQYHTHEGTFSAYIDAVTGRMGPSSYAGDDTLTPVDLDASAADLTAQIAALFATYTEETVAP